MTDSAIASTPGGTADRDWTTEVITDEVDFQRIGDDWDGLYLRCRRATPFQAYGWVDAHRQAYARPGQLHVVAVRRGGQLVGLAPFVRVWRGPWRVLRPLAAEASTYGDLLVDDSVAEAGRRLIAGVLATTGWLLLDMPEVGPRAVVRDLLEHWPYGVKQLKGSITTSVEAAPLERRLPDFSGASRERRRRKLRRVRQAGLTISSVSGSPRAQVDLLLDLHKQQWGGRGGNPEHMSPRFRQFLGDAADRMVPRHQASLLEYRSGQDIRGMALNLVGHEVLIGYLYGCRPELRRELDVSTLFLQGALQQALARDLATVSLGRSVNAQLARSWGPALVCNDRLILPAPGCARAVMLYSWAARAHRACAELARQRLPVVGAPRRRVTAARTSLAVSLRRALLQVVGRVSARPDV